MPRNQFRKQVISVDTIIIGAKLLKVQAIPVR